MFLQKIIWDLHKLAQANFIPFFITRFGEKLKFLPDATLEGKVDRTDFP